MKLALSFLAVSLQEEEDHLLALVGDVILDESNALDIFVEELKHFNSFADIE